MRNKGVTIVELVILILIVAIMAVIAIPRIFDLQTLRENATLSKVKKDLEYVKEYAINNNVRTRLSYDLSGNTSYTATKYESASWQDMVDPFTSTTPFTVTLNSGSYSGVALTSVNFDGQTIIEFDSIGRPYSYSGVSSSLLVADGVITITGGSTINITVDTGRID